MLDALWQVGVTQGLGVFFFLFICLAVITWKFFTKVMADNEAREQRYLAVIENLSCSAGELKTLTACVHELREENKDSHQGIQNLIGRVLDRLPKLKG